MKLSNKRKLLLILVILTLAFIFGHSFLNQSISNTESKMVKENIVQPINEAVTGNKKVSFNIRDIAHIIEFAVLGLELVFLSRDEKRMRCLIRTISYCGMVALLDESIQFLFDRIPQVIDIWGDILGGIIGATIGLIYIIVKKYAEKRRVENDKATTSYSNYRKLRGWS